MIMHFKSQKERLDYLKGNYEEITPTEVIPHEVKENRSTEVTDAVEEVTEKPKKSRKKKEKKDDAVSAE